MRNKKMRNKLNWEEIDSRRRNEFDKMKKMNGRNEVDSMEKKWNGWFCENNEG